MYVRPRNVTKIPKNPSEAAADRPSRSAAVVSQTNGKRMQMSVTMTMRVLLGGNHKVCTLRRSEISVQSTVVLHEFYSINQQPVRTRGREG